MTTWKPRQTQSTWNATSLLVSSCCRHTHSLHTTSRCSSCPRVCIHPIHAWSERHSSTLSSPFHPTSYSYSPSISSSSCFPSTSTRIRSNTVLRQQGDGVNWLILLPHSISTIDEVFSDCALPSPLGPTPWWRRESISNIWADVCGFLKPPASQRFWKVNKHGAFFFFTHRQVLGLRSSDQSCHLETWLHLQFVEWSNSGTIRLTTTGIFASRKGQRALEILLQHVTSAKYWATTRSHLDRETTSAPGSHSFPCSSSRSDLMSFDISSISSVFLVIRSSCSSCAHCPKKKRKPRMLVLWKLTGPQGSVWNILYHNTTTDPRWKIHISCRQSDSARYPYEQSRSVLQSWSSVVSSPHHHGHWLTLCIGSRNRFTAYDTHSYYFIMVA